MIITNERAMTNCNVTFVGAAQVCNSSRISTGHLWYGQLARMLPLQRVSLGQHADTSEGVILPSFNSGHVASQASLDNCAILLPHPLGTAFVHEVKQPSSGWTIGAKALKIGLVEVPADPSLKCIIFRVIRMVQDDEIHTALAFIQPFVLQRFNSQYDISKNETNSSPMARFLTHLRNSKNEDQQQE